MSKELDKELSVNDESELAKAEPEAKKENEAKELTKEERKAKKDNENNSKKAAAAKKPKKSIKKFFKDARAEFKKVVWPSRKQVFNNTVVVLTALVIASLGIWLMDSAFGWVLRTVLNMN